MIRISQLFWCVVGIEAALLLALFVIALQDRAGAHDGGRAMGIFFYVVVPALALALAVALFYFSASVMARSIALFVVLVPAIWFAKSRIEERLIDRQIEARRSGVGYFASDAMRQMGSAVVRRDVATLLSVGRGVDVNTVGLDDMTLMRLATDLPDPRYSDGSELPVVRTLLALGANADTAMPAACARSDSALLDTLLAAGGNPNLMLHDDGPLVFTVMSIITPHNFRRLAAQGLNLDTRSRGDPLAVQLVIYRRLDLLMIAIELGADMTLARPDGRTVQGEIAAQIAEHASTGREIPDDLLLARTALQTVGAPR
jgi:hypothetical protein